MTTVYIVQHGMEVYVGSDAVRPDGQVVVTARDNKDMASLLITGLARRPDSDKQTARFGVPEITGHFFLPALFDWKLMARPILMGIDKGGRARVQMRLIESDKTEKLVSVIVTPDKEITFSLSSLEGRIRPVELAILRNDLPVEPVFLDGEKPEVTKRLSAGNYQLLARILEEDQPVCRGARLTLTDPVDQVGGSEEADLEILPP